MKTPKATFTRSEVAKIAGMPVGLVQILASRGQLPTYDPPGGQSNLLDNIPEDSAGGGWTRYTSFEVLKILVAREFAAANSSFEGLSFPDAAKIVDNDQGAIFEAASAVFAGTGSILGPYWIGYAWHDEGGGQLSGSLPEITSVVSRRGNVKSIALVDVSRCARLFRSRLIELGHASESGFNESFFPKKQ